MRLCYVIAVCGLGARLVVFRDVAASYSDHFKTDFTHSGTVCI